MTEAHGQEHPVEAGALPPEPDQAPAESIESARPGGASRRTVWWLASLLLLVIAGVGSSPFWARDVAPLLPWGEPARSAKRGLRRARRPAGGDRETARAAVPRCRRDQFGDRARWRAGSISWRPRATRIGKATRRFAAAKAGLQQIEERLSAFEAQSASRSAGEAAQFEKLRQELAQIGSVSADLADRLSAIERRVGATGNAARTDAALLAALLRMREAVEAARPFAAEYDAFIATRP